MLMGKVNVCFSCIVQWVRVLCVGLRFLVVHVVGNFSIWQVALLSMQAFLLLYVLASNKMILLGISNCLCTKIECN